MSRLARLRAVSLREVADRARYGSFCAVERRRHAAGSLVSPRRLRASLVPELRDRDDWASRLVEGRRAAGRRGFFAGIEDAHRSRDIVRQRFSTELANLRGDADAVRAHRVTFFGQTFELGPSIDWHADPVSGRRWPVVYHRDVPVHASTEFGDVKYVWELGRHQFLVDAAKAYFLLGDSAEATEVRRLVGDWMAQNPYGTGVHWACALEPAFRAFSWLWAYYFTLDDPAFDDEAHLAWLTGFLDHGHFLFRHLEYHTSPFNHLVGEASALYCLGVLFPEFEESTRWRAHGRATLEAYLPREFYEDGCSVEQSFFYHHATLAFYALAALLGRRNGEEFSPAVFSALERACAFAMHVTQPDGFTPRVGGADDGKPLKVERAPWWDFRAWQAVGAVLFGRGDMKRAAGRFREDAFWLLGEDGATAFERVPARTPELAVRLEPSGYAVMRSDWSPTADYVLFDCGPQAGELRTDSVPNSVHGHADALSVQVVLQGTPVLVDAGLYAYNAAPEWVGHFRRTAAHNTARIDGRDQARYLGKMKWSESYVARIDDWNALDGNAFVRGQHDGFAREPAPVVHHRAVWLRAGYVLVLDEFVADGPHRLELVFQAAPFTWAMVAPDTLGVDERFDLTWRAGFPLDASVTCGGEGPEGGWIAPSLGGLEAAPRLALKGDTAPASAWVLTVVVPSGRLVVGGDTGGLVMIAGDGGEDEVRVVAAGSVSGAGPSRRMSLRVTTRRTSRVSEVLVDGLAEGAA